ncbi:MAG: hypothetical protein Q8J69_01050 [Sphingobacteriaceae bacterium]|nr:hypothetical protein [Sphingobacteriaceae bacterium]
MNYKMYIPLRFRKQLAIGLLTLLVLPFSALAQQDPRDEFYTPPSNAKFLKATSGTSNDVYQGDFDWAIRFYPARLWYTTTYFGFERSLTKWFNLSLDAGWHNRAGGLFINAFGPASVFDGEFDGPVVRSSQSYGNLLLNGSSLRNNIPTIGFSARFFTEDKETHNVPFFQFQYQFSQADFLMKDYGRERFAGGNDTASLQLHTAMLRFGRQWTYGKKIKILNEVSIGVGANMRLSSAYQAVTITSGTPGTTSYNFYNLNSLTGEQQRVITPRFQFAYSIGIAY